MRERRRGWIVNISSGAGLHPKPPYGGRVGGTVYGMCKAALERFTTGLASEVQQDGIAVNVVSPGLVDTPGVAVHGLINETKDRVQPISTSPRPSFDWPAAIRRRSPAGSPTPSRF